jgi:hypothetical protein
MAAALIKIYEQDSPIRTAVKSSGSCQDGAKESIFLKFVLKLMIFSAIKCFSLRFELLE